MGKRSGTISRPTNGRWLLVAIAKKLASRRLALRAWRAAAFQITAGSFTFGPDWSLPGATRELELDRGPHRLRCSETWPPAESLESLRLHRRQHAGCRGRR